jgi:AAA+ ATPase superfamily predicted ATPase
MMIIDRKEKDILRSYKNWIFVFGRRKTGKSFLVKNFINWDDYFFIKRDKTILSEKEENLNYETLISILKRGLNENKTIVIDEFHRLGGDFFDFIHSLNKKGKLIIISSTLFLSKKLLSEKSPILGLFSEMPIKLISLKDTLKALKKIKLTKKERIENGILLREPITINSFDKNKKAREIFSKVILSNINTIPALIGEIFLEEEKTLSAIYEGILRAIASGKISSTKIADYLFSKKLIINNDASIVQQYLKNLIGFGIIKKIRVYNKNKFIYKHISSLVRLFYYADEKYNISERDITEDEIRRIVEEIMPKVVEDNIREFLAKKFGLSEAVIETKDYDIDVCLLKFNKPGVIAEVKWKEKINEKEIRKIEENLSKINARKKYLIVQDKTKIKTKIKGIEVAEVMDFITL